MQLKPIYTLDKDKEEEIIDNISTLSKLIVEPKPSNQKGKQRADNVVYPTLLNIKTNRNLTSRYINLSLLNSNRDNYSSKGSSSNSNKGQSSKI